MMPWNLGTHRHTHTTGTQSLSHKRTGTLPVLLPGRTWEADTMRPPNYPLPPLAWAMPLPLTRTAPVPFPNISVQGPGRQGHNTVGKPQRQPAPPALASLLSSWPGGAGAPGAAGPAAGPCGAGCGQARPHGSLERDPHAIRGHGVQQHA